MLRHKSKMSGYAVQASDGLIGTVRDFLFDDVAWLVRWLVIDTGNWLPGRMVLLPPNALGVADPSARLFSTKLTRQQVKECPDIESDRPVSRQMETNIYNYYGWTPYWGGSFLDAAGYGGGYLGRSASVQSSLDLMQRERKVDDAQRSKDDPALRSANEVVGYHIHASDGEIGHVDDFLIEDDDWSVRYFVVDTKNWWPGKKVLIPPLSVLKIEWTNRLVNLRADRVWVKESPAYDPTMTAGPGDQTNFHLFSPHPGPAYDSRRPLRPVNF